MNYTLGEIAKIIGISKEGIRYFEKQNCIREPKRNASGYREYDPWQMGTLRWLKLYRSYDYTLKESAELLEIGQANERTEIFERGLARTEAQIVFLQRRAADLRDFLNERARVEAEENKIEEIISPGLYRVSFEYKEQLLLQERGENFFRPWIEHMPFVKYTPAFYKADIEQGVFAMDYGFGIFERDIFNWRPWESPHVQYFSPRRCVTAIVRSSCLSMDSFRAMFEYMNARSLILDGDFFCRPIDIRQNGDLPEFICRYYLPVREM